MHKRCGSNVINGRPHCLVTLLLLLPRSVHLMLLECIEEAIFRMHSKWARLRFSEEGEDQEQRQEQQQEEEIVVYIPLERRFLLVAMATLQC